MESLIFIRVLFLVYVNPISLLINIASLSLRIKVMKITFSMADNLYEIDSAMNLIKEDIIRELSESVSKQNKKPYYRQTLSNNVSFSDKTLD